MFLIIQFFRLFSILIPIFLLSIQNSYSLEAGLARVKTTFGVHYAVFNLHQGKLKVYFPADMVISEVVSGGYSFEPYSIMSSDTKEKKFSIDDFSLVIENKEVKVGEQNFKITLPHNLPTGVLTVSLRDKRGKDISRAYFPVKLTKPNTDWSASTSVNFKLPVNGRSGVFNEISGPFDGDYSTSEVRLSGQKLKIISESRRKLIFENSTEIFGNRILSLNETGVLLSTPFMNLQTIKVDEDKKFYTEVDERPTRTASTKTREELLEENQMEESKEARELEKKFDNIKSEKKDFMMYRRLDIYPLPEPRVAGTEDVAEILGTPESLGESTEINESEELIVETTVNEKEMVVAEEEKEEDKDKVKDETKPIKKIEKFQEEESLDISYEDMNEVEEQLNSQFSLPLYSQYSDFQKRTNVASKKVSISPKVIEKAEKKEQKQPRESKEIIPESEKTSEKKEIAKIKEEESDGISINDTDKDTKFAVQIGSFRKESEAKNLVNLLKSSGHKAYYKKFYVPDKGYWYRVRVGDFETRNEAGEYSKKIDPVEFSVSSTFVTPVE